MELFIVGLLIGMFIAWATMWFMMKVVVSRITKSVNDVLEQVSSSVEKESNKTTIMARVELHDDTFYVYNNDTNEFMAQGKTLGEVKEHMFKRFDKTKFNVIADPELNVDVLKKLKETANETSNSI